MKKIILSVVSLFIVLSVLFFSCDKIEKDEYLKPVDDLQWNGRKILLEEFTGHRCTNCPEATAVAKVLASTYPNIVLISIHAGTLANPTVSGSYMTDYNTPEGTAIYESFKVTATPMGLVSRNIYQNQDVLQSGDWASAITSIYYTLPMLDLSLDGTSYDSTSRKIQVKATVKFNQKITEDLNIIYAITEDNLTSPQKFPTSDSLQYTHQHVLRQMPSGIWGEQFLSKSNNEKIGDEKMITKEFELIEKVVPENCNIVVYITNRETKEVLQVEELLINGIVK